MRGHGAFVALRSSARRARNGAVTVQFALVGDDEVRVAYAVARRVGGAVERNRWRRRLRAIAAEAAAELPPGAYLIGLSARVHELDFNRLREQVTTTMREASGGRR